MALLTDARRELDRNHWVLLILLGAAAFFEGYDVSIFAVALPAIRESFGLSQASAAWYLAIIHAGALPALFISRRADRIGRRQTLLVSIVGYTVFTGLTAISPNIGVYTGLQFCARLFITAEAAIAFAMIAEELPARTRGFGFGWLASLTAIGTGLAAIVNGAIFAPLGINWRFLYLVGVPPLIAITFFRRKLPESKRFEIARDAGELAGSWREIVRRPYRRWLVLICIVATAATLTTFAVDFAIDFMQTERGLSATVTNLLLVAAGAPAIPILVLAGALSDRIGRKVVACSTIALSVIGGAGFFFVDAGIGVMYVFLTLTIIGFAVASPTIGAFNAELFPTSLRSQAGAWANTFRVVGQVLSLGLGSVLLASLGSLPLTAVILFVGPIIVVLVIAVFFPETKGRELEDTSAGPDVDPHVNDEEGLEESTTVFPI